MVTIRRRMSVLLVICLVLFALYYLPASSASRTFFCSTESLNRAEKSVHAINEALSAPSSSLLSATDTGFPKVIWQKTSSKTFSDLIKADLGSWREKNPFFSFNLLTDEDSTELVSQNFQHRPDILDLYLSLQVPILKADFLRYLILYAKGGIWADLDVSCLKSVDEWFPLEYEKAATVVVGIEGIQNYRGPHYALGSQFASWTVMAKPKSPHILYVINSIVEELQNVAALYQVGYEGIELGMISDVVDVTGPYKMTLGIIRSLSQQTGYILDDRDFAKIKSPTNVGDVLILPGAAFSAFQSGYPQDEGDRLVTHHYAGSWKEEADESRKQRLLQKQKKI